MMKNFLSGDEPESPTESTTESTPSRSDGILHIFDEEPDRPAPAEPDNKQPFTLADDPDSMRQSGLAYSAGIAFFAAVVFMLILGWGADVLLGTSPWGIVVGIVLGSIIGFVQFFRITSQIFKK
jgi:F0F1-type ATP synthase assembly protein I